MTIQQPYYRICRPFTDGNYIQSIESTYLTDPRYASDRVDFIRGYHLLEDALIRLFEFVEPTDANLKCYSHQIYSLLLRASTEFESNARAILSANNYVRPGNWNITDYFKLNSATRLSEFAITVPIWNGPYRRFHPFDGWHTGHSLTWYQAYNDVKHNRFGNFGFASLENAVKAVGAVFAILFAQFNIFAFDPYHPVSMFGTDANVWSHEACLLAVELPTHWPAVEQYDFEWESLKTQSSPFQAYSF